MDWKKETSKNIKRFMEYRELDATELASDCGMSMERLQSILNEESLLTLEELAAISATYNVTTEFILGTVKYPFPIARTPEIAEFYKKLSEMSDEELNDLFEKLEKERQQNKEKGCDCI